MWICPICDKRNYSNSVCSQCGFDSSLDYERFPTAAPIDLDTAKTIVELKAERKSRKQFSKKNTKESKDATDGIVRKKKHRVLTFFVILLILFALAVLVSYVAAIVNSNPNLDGYGTAFQPYRITSAEELDMIREDMNAHYILCDDINLSSISSWKPIGSENSKFRGSFKGNGHVISNINISARYSRGNTPFTSVYVGLFGYVYRSEISNLRIENATYTVTSDDYDDDRYINIGGIIGAAKQSRIEQCYFFGTINGSVEDNANIRESGIVAVGIQSEIVDCCNISILNASAKNNKTLIAGISALLDESSIDKCLSAGKISGESAEGECFIGGINACGESGNWYNRKEASTVKRCAVIMQEITSSNEQVSIDEISVNSEKSNNLIISQEDLSSDMQSIFEELEWDFDNTWIMNGSLPMLRQSTQAIPWFVWNISRLFSWLKKTMS